MSPLQPLPEFLHGIVRDVLHEPLLPPSPPVPTALPRIGLLSGPPLGLPAPQLIEAEILQDQATIRIQDSGNQAVQALAPATVKLPDFSMVAEPAQPPQSGGQLQPLQPEACDLSPHALIRLGGGTRPQQ